MKKTVIICLGLIVITCLGATFFPPGPGTATYPATKVMSIPTGGAALADMLVATSSYVGQPGVSFPGQKEMALWWAGNIGTGSNAWNYTAVDFLEGIHQIGHPYAMPSVSPPGFNFYLNGNATDAAQSNSVANNGSCYYLHQMNPWSDFNGICIPMAITNVVGSPALTNSQGVKIYEADNFGMQIGSISPCQNQGETNQCGSYVILSQANYPTFFSCNSGAIGTEPGGIYSQHSWVAFNPAAAEWQVKFPKLVPNVWNVVTNTASANVDSLFIDEKRDFIKINSNLVVGAQLYLTQQVITASSVLGPNWVNIGDNIPFVQTTNWAWGPQSASASAYTFDSPHAGAYRLGFVKQNGAFPTMAHGSTAPFTISRASAASLQNAGNVAGLTMTEELKIDSSGNLAYTGGSNLMNGTWHYKIPTYSKTANYTVLTTEVGASFDNIGTAGTVTNSLPAATAGLHYSLDVEVAQNLAFKANGTDTIRNAATVSAAGGLVFSSTIGGTVHITCHGAGKWVVDQLIGTWTVQ